MIWFSKTETKIYADCPGTIDWLVILKVSFIPSEAVHGIFTTRYINTPIQSHLRSLKYSLFIEFSATSSSDVIKYNYYILNISDSSTVTLNPKFTLKIMLNLQPVIQVILLKR